MQRTSSILNARRHSIAKSGVPISWAAVYFATTLTLWVISPFLRRLVDWKSTFAAISPIAALPLAILVPAALMTLNARQHRVSRSFELIAALWILGLTYALVVATIDGRLLGGLYAFAEFLLPLGFGYWVATSKDDSGTWYRRFSTTLVILAILSSLYGILQFVILPPWDKQWMISIKMASNGIPVPFGFRVFSTLNAPATFAIFLAVAIIVFLPRLTRKNAILLLPVFAGLALTSIRASWITAVVGIVVFAALTTRRKVVLQGVGTFIGIGLLAVLCSTAFTGDSNDVAARVSNRFATLGDVANDASAVDRARQMSEAFTASLADPEGLGMGAVGVATRLSSSEQQASVIDSGYLARLLEMGFPGTAAFLAALFVALGASIKAWRRAVEAKATQNQDIAALAVTIVVVMFMLNVFGDSGFGLAAIAMWVTLAIVLRSSESSEKTSSFK